MRLLVDTSVWIDFFRGVDSDKVRFLTTAIEKREDICCCGFILTEVFQGIRDETELRSVKKLFDGLVYLESDRSTFELGARIYRELRRNGCTIRNSIDCLIGATVLQHGVNFLESDRDYRFIDEHFPLNRVC